MTCFRPYHTRILSQTIDFIRQVWYIYISFSCKPVRCYVDGGPAWGLLEENIGTYKREFAPSCRFSLVWSAEGVIKPFCKEFVVLSIARDTEYSNALLIVTYGGWRLRYYPERRGEAIAFPRRSIPDIIREVAATAIKNGASRRLYPMTPMWTRN